MKKNCEICSKEFEGRTSLAKFCSKECKNKNHNNIHGKPSTFDGFCLGCKIDISDRESKRKRYCTEECKQKHETKQEVQNRLKKTKTCLNCNINYNNKSNSSKFCSMKCMGEYTKNDNVKLNCNNCNKEYEIIFYNRHKSKFCSRECAGVFNNKNLNKKEFSEKVSKGLKQHYKENIHPWVGKNHSEETKDKTRKTRKERGLDQPEKNPMYNKNHTVDTKEKMSKIVSERLKNGKLSRSGDFYSNKNNCNINYDSSWEKAFFEALEKDDNVIKYIPHEVIIPYFHEYNRNYITDLLIEYRNGDKKIIEIKPLFFTNLERYEINQQKFKYTNDYCEKNNMLFEVWTEDNNPYYSKKYLIDYSNNFTREINK